MSTAQFTAAESTAGGPYAPAVEERRGIAIASFVLGLASIVAGWTFFAPLAGVILGAVALRRGTSERTLALWGVWLNAVMLALAALGLVVALLLIGAGLLAVPFFLV